MADLYESPGPAAALLGLDRALEKLVGARAPEVQIEAGQALFWMTTLDELLRTRHGEPYDSARGLDADGVVIDGARLARNAITHGATVLQDTAQGRVWPLVWPVDWTHQAWVSLEVLMADWTPRITAHLPRQKSVYTDQLAGVVSYLPLERARRWLTTAAALGFTL